MTAKQVKENATSTWHGIKRFYLVSIGVIEACAWLGTQLTNYGVIYADLKGYVSLSMPVFYGLCASAVLISFRMAYEFMKYLRDLGRTYEH
jgi:hypothetical protein